MSKLWAVTGATGLVGNNLVRQLLGSGERVRVHARGGVRKELAGLDVQLVSGDLDASAAQALCTGADVIVHAAANVWIGVTGSEAVHQVNVGGTAIMLAAAAKVAPTARFVQVSSVDALGLGTRASPATEATTPKPHEGGVAYVDSKRAADVLVRATALDWVIVHPTYMIGPYDWKPSSSRMLLELAAGKGIMAPAGGNNFVDVRDVARGIQAVAERAPTGSSWILGNEHLTYFEAWTRMAKVIGARPPVAELPGWMARLAAGLMHVPLWLGFPEGEINPATTRMSTLPHYHDPGKAQRELGLVATPLDTAIADAWAWFGANGYR